ncbi:MAG: hypothetical protein ACRDI1_01685 [Actinomycetota bacterium]|jgi:hypothetical protein
MELDGHPTQDIVDELQRRGALAYRGTESGPDPDSLELARHRKNPNAGIWLFLPREAYETGMDEEPPLT